MFRSPTHRAAAFAAVLLPFLAVACGPDNAGNPAAPASIGGPSLSAADLGAGDGLANFEFIEVCKYGSTADVTVDMTQTSSGNTSVTYSFAAGECRNLGNFDNTVGLGPADISASESNIETGFQFDSLKTTIIHRNPAAPPTVTVSTTNSFSILGASNDIGILLEFYNSAIPTPGDEGCTPGYWKQSQHFDSWFGYTPNQTLESVFDVPDGLGYDNTTLLEALNFGGGSGVAGGARILLRSAVAALLNSSSPDVDYTMTTGEVIAAVNAALASGSRATMLTLAAELDTDNNLGCPLN
jgi:hypothetical protein